MSTIANRLNIVADMLADEGFRPRMPAEPAAIQLAAMECRKIASELEAAPAEDAVPVVATVYRNGTGVFGYATMLERWEDGSRSLPIGSHRLVTEADHLSAIDHWQKRALEAEARIAWVGPVGVPHAAGSARTPGVMTMPIRGWRRKSVLPECNDVFTTHPEEAQQWGERAHAVVDYADHLSAIAALQEQIAALQAQTRHAEDVVEAAKHRIDELTAELEARQVTEGR